MATFYLDGTTLANSTAVYSDVDLTTLADDGFYSDGVIYREQVSGVLLPAVTCSDCNPPIACTNIPTFPPGQGGRYPFSVNVGETATDIGAIVISFHTGVAPDGIRVTYDSVVYNGLSSNSSTTGGWKKGTSGNYTFLGSTIAYTSNPPNTAPQVCSQDMINNVPYTIARDNYVLNTTTNQWVADGTSTNVSIAAGDLKFEVNPDMSTAPKTWNTMVIPKLNATPSVVDVEIVSTCASTGWDFEIECPTSLPSLSTSSTFAGDSTTACGLTIDGTTYRAGSRDTGSTLRLWDLVFNNSNGTQKKLAGFYRYSGGWFQVDSNGVVVDMNVCS